MSYQPEGRQRAVELSEQGPTASQVRAQLIREECRSVPSAASISGWVRNARHSNGVDEGWRCAELIAEIVRANVTTSASTREIGWRFRVAASSVASWMHKFAPDAGSRRGMRGCPILCVRAANRLPRQHAHCVHLRHTTGGVVDQYHA